MRILTTFAVLGISWMLVLSACSDNGGGKMKDKDTGERCDHAQVKSFTVKISAGKDKGKPPKVDKETIVACLEDDIVFEGDVEDFTIAFKKGSPFEGDLKSKQGKAKGKVKADPKGKTVTYKYDVIVPGYPVLDPKIIIRAR